MTLGDTGTFLVRQFLMGFIMAMVGINDVLELAELALEMDSGYLRIIEMGACRRCVPVSPMN